MTVELVYTERRSDLTEDRARNLARLHEQVVAASGANVAAMHYEEVDAVRLARASAIVLSGSTAAWASRDRTELEALGEAVLACDRPVFGICAGMQLLTVFAGGRHEPSRAEHGFLPIDVHDAGDLLRGLPADAVVFHDHSEEITVLPEGFRVLASSRACAVQAFAAPERRWWGTQFHPEEWTEQHADSEPVLANFFELAGGGRPMNGVRLKPDP